VAAATRWRDLGFVKLHVVDLDAATGRGDNGAVIDALVELDGVSLQVGGGLAATERVTALLDRGASVAVVGTRAVQDPAWLEGLALMSPGRIVVAADVRGREVVVRGWTVGAGLDVLDFMTRLRGLPLAGVLVTAVHVEGRLEGPDLDLMHAVRMATELPLLASGGIRSLADLRDLDRAGAAGAVIGMALYTGALDPRAVAEEFGQ
jgi:phosphoribosylformimino-5-aminoimidazole carboxamide ribotide isomerase